MAEYSIECQLKQSYEIVLIGTLLKLNYSQYLILYELLLFYRLSVSIVLVKMPVSHINNSFIFSTYLANVIWHVCTSFISKVRHFMITSNFKLITVDNSNDSTIFIQ